MLINIKELKRSRAVKAVATLSCAGVFTASTAFIQVGSNSADASITHIKMDPIAEINSSRSNLSCAFGNVGGADFIKNKAEAEYPLDAAAHKALIDEYECNGAILRYKKDYSYTSPVDNTQYHFKFLTGRELSEFKVRSEEFIQTNKQINGHSIPEHVLKGAHMAMEVTGYKTVQNLKIATLESGYQGSLNTEALSEANAQGTYQFLKNTAFRRAHETIGTPLEQFFPEAKELVSHTYYSKSLGRENTIRYIPINSEIKKPWKNQDLEKENKLFKKYSVDPFLSSVLVALNSISDANSLRSNHAEKPYSELQHYTMHFLGAGGSKRFLSSLASEPDAPAYKVFSYTDNKGKHFDGSETKQFLHNQPTFTYTDKEGIVQNRSFAQVENLFRRKGLTDAEVDLTLAQSTYLLNAEFKIEPRDSSMYVNQQGELEQQEPLQQLASIKTPERT